ncbi:MAG: tRNA epoxyqueuosine(34) reductase QueG [Bryobacter sp.]|nr:tRNA epoxyqueuosine(34) reductase QueG [Bryobacter sp.]
MTVPAQLLLDLAHACGFELAGLTPATPHSDYVRYSHWVENGHAAEMRYLTDHRGPLRADPQNLLPRARTMLCVGKLYKTSVPQNHTETPPGHGWISRYAWGARDYHDVLREGLESFVARLRETLPEPFAHRICVDTAPLLERSYARSAGLGWIGKNTCLIHEPLGSWFFLGEVLFDFQVDQYNQAPPDRCGTCTRCIEACPTAAIVPTVDHYTIDSARCISYWTIEAKEAAPPELRAQFGNHIFGCDICQDVCPWNRRAPETEEAAFAPANAMPNLQELVALSDDEFRRRFRQTPIARTKRAGLARNAEIALQNHRQQAG